MEGLGSLLLFALFFFFMMRFGCGAHMMHGHGHSHSKGSGKKQVDPVCYTEIDPDQGYGKMYQGSLYRFCSKTCLDKFDTEPERYIDKQQEHHHAM